MARKKKKAQNIQTKMRPKSTAQLERAMKKLLDTPDPEEPVDFASAEWAGPSPVHTIHGVPYEELKKNEEELLRMKKEKEEKDESTQ